MESCTLRQIPMVVAVPASMSTCLWEGTPTRKVLFKDFDDCVDSIAVPLDGSPCLVGKRTLDSYKLSIAMLEKAAELSQTQTLKITVLMPDRDYPYGGTILRIEADCKHDIRRGARGFRSEFAVAL